MDDALGHEITQLLQAWRQGDESALDKLTPQIYRELHRASRRCMGGERDGHTLQTTALINELYLRLSDLKLIDWQNRAHFFALCARQMRRILTDQARCTNRLLAPEYRVTRLRFLSRPIADWDSHLIPSFVDCLFTWKPLCGRPTSRP
jgi:ECF sigma factor